MPTIALFLDEFPFMGFHLEKDEPVGSAFQRMLLEEAARMSEGLRAANDNPQEAIHQVRKRCKRVRAIVRLLRPRAKAIYLRENAAFRKMARRFSSFRDADVQLKTFDELVPDPASERFCVLQDPIVMRHETKEPKPAIDLTVGELNEAEVRLKGANITDSEGSDLIESGLRSCYGRGQRAMLRACDKRDDAAFHEWRKRVKDLGYEMRILRELWPAVLGRLRKQLDKLGDLLGKHHDLLRSAALKQIDDISGKTVRQFLELVESRKLELQTEAQTIGERVYAEKPGILCGGCARTGKRGGLKRPRPPTPNRK